MNDFLKEGIMLDLDAPEVAERVKVIEKLSTQADPDSFSLSSNYVGYEISQATHREQNIIQAITDFLQSEGIEFLTLDEYAEDADALDSNEEYAEQMLADYCWDYLFELMDGIAPAGCYFGARSGNGSLFGFWLIENEDC